LRFVGRERPIVVAHGQPNLVEGHDKAPAKTGDPVPGPRLRLGSAGEGLICVGTGDLPAPVPGPDPQTDDASLLSHAESVALEAIDDLAQNDE